MLYILVVESDNIGPVYFGPFDNEIDAADWWQDNREQFPGTRNMPFRVEPIHNPADGGGA